MLENRKIYPGGYNRTVFRTGTCSCCGCRPIAKGNYFLCSTCHTGEFGIQKDTPKDEDIITREEALELCIKVSEMEKTPPTPVKHFSCKDYTQEQLREILNGGAA